MAGKTSSKKTHNHLGESPEKKDSGLTSPTSISMQNTFIIKNAGESFDNYYQQMKKRKLGHSQN